MKVMWEFVLRKILVFFFSIFTIIWQDVVSIFEKK